MKDLKTNRPFQVKFYQRTSKQFITHNE